MEGCEKEATPCLGNVCSGDVLKGDILRKLLGKSVHYRLAAHLLASEGSWNYT